MKKSAYFTIIVLAFCMSILISGCSKPIASPTGLYVDNKDELTWSAVPSAGSYIVESKRVDNGEIYTGYPKRTTYSLSGLEEGHYEIRVKAVADKSSVKDSDWSKMIPFYREYETGCIYTLINNNTEYQITKAGNTVSGDLEIQDYYRGRPVTTIAPGAFKGNYNIENIVIGNNVRSIGYNAFYNCTKLTSITIPDSVTEIGYAAFQGCKSLKSITIPNRITTIYDYTFASCGALEEVIWGENIKTIMYSAFSNCFELKSIDIPDSVISIGEFAFSENSSITSVTLGSGLTVLGDKAFYRCFKLESVTFSDDNHLTKIGNYAFAECSVLSRIELPDGLTSIGNWAFLQSEQLSEVTIPDSVNHVGANAFNATKIFYDAIFERQEDLVYADRWLVYCTSPLRVGLISISGSFLKSGVVGIADEVFWRAEKLETVTFPSSLRYIGNYAFYNSAVLWKIVVPDNSVQDIGDAAFAGCELLLNISLGNGLKTIGASAFLGCSKLDNSNQGSIIPQSVISIGYFAFKDTALWVNTADDKIVYAGNWVVGNKFPEDSDWAIHDNLPDGTVGISDFAFYRSMLGSLGGTEKLQHIGFAAFYGCYALGSIALNDNLTEIKDYTFYGCMSFTNVVFPKNLKSIGRSAYYYCSNLREIDLSDSRVETIGDFAFYLCNLKEGVNLGNHLKSIGRYAFNRSGLSSIDLPDTLLTIGERAFSNCELLTEVTIGSGVTVIGNYAFNGCAALQSITIPSSVKVIGNNAFFNCKAATQLIFENGVETIGNYAFYGMKNITKLVIPKSVVSIGNYAFKGCSSLLSVVINSNIRQIGAHAFYDCKEMTIYTDAESIPEGWNRRWNSSYRPVVFGCKLPDDSSFVVSVIIKDKTLLNVNSFSNVNAPVRDGYIFMGWTTRSGATVAEFSAEDIAKVPSGTTLYAVWAISEAE